MNRKNSEARELTLDNRLRQINQEVWETEDVEKLQELKAERLLIMEELTELRLSLYMNRTGNV